MTLKSQAVLRSLMLTASEEQMELMAEGLSLGQVGQRPFEMGYKTMYFLLDIKKNGKNPADPTYTGLDVCTPETAKTCIGG